MNKRDITPFDTIKVLMLKGEKGDTGGVSESEMNSAISEAVADEARTRASNDTAISESVNQSVNILEAQMNNFIADHAGLASETVLWTGDLYQPYQSPATTPTGGKATLSDEVSNYDYIGVYTTIEYYSHSSNERTPTVHWYNASDFAEKLTTVICGTTDMGGSPLVGIPYISLIVDSDEVTVTVFEAGITKWDGDSETNAGLTVSGDNTNRQGSVVKIVGIKNEQIDAEVIDIRVGADGTVYQTAGEAVRTQIQNAGVVDGSVTTAKLADEAVTNLKLADESVTMEKTDFYSVESIEFQPNWMNIVTNTTGYKAGFTIDDDDLATAISEFPDNLYVIGILSAYATPSYAYFRVTGTMSGTITTNVTLENSTLIYNGTTYTYAKITKSDFLEAYATYASHTGMGTKQGFSFGLGKLDQLVQSDIKILNTQPTIEMIASGFAGETHLSEDFANAVKAVFDGESADYTTVKEALNGKVMLCLGDSYIVYMNSLLSSLASKYGMAYDGRGVVSSTITNQGTSPMVTRVDTIVSDYESGYTIDSESYSATDVGVVVFMGGANDGFGVNTYIGTGTHETDKSLIYGACNYIFNQLMQTFTNAIFICITQPANYNRTVSSITSDATAQILGFDDLAELQVMDDYQFSNFSMAQKEKAVKDTAWVYGWDILDMFNEFPSMLNPSNRSVYWSTDKIHLTTAGYNIISKALDNKIVEIVVG